MTNYANKRQKVVVGQLQAIGQTQTINSQTITVLERDSAGLITKATGTAAASTQDAQAVYAKSAEYIKTNVASGTTAIYENIGDTSSSSFNLIGGISAGEITLARGFILAGNSSGVAAALDANDSGKILVGDGTDLNSVAVSGDVALATNGAMTVTDLTITSEARGDLLRRGASAWERFDANNSGQIIVGDGTDVVSVAVSGDATLSGAGVLTVTDVTVGSDAAGDLLYKSSATALTRLAKGTNGQMLLMDAGAANPSWVSMSGDITMTNGVTAIGANLVTLAKLARSDAAGKFLIGQGASSDTAYGTMSGDATLDGSGALTISADKITPAKMKLSEALTSTADGLTTGLMSGNTSHAVVTSASATNYITLPASSAALVGKTFTIWVAANGFELVTPASSNATINGADADGTNQADIPANSLTRCTLVDTNTWLMENIGANGTVAAAIVPDND